MSTAQNEFHQRLKRIHSGAGHVSGTSLAGEGSVKSTKAKRVAKTAKPKNNINPFKFGGALLIGAGSVLAGQKLANSVLSGATPIPTEILTQVVSAVSEPQIALGIAVLIAVAARIFLRLESKLQTLILVASFCVMAFQP